jgi:glutamate-1-semialdehyde 2,1-aminomutase
MQKNLSEKAYKEASRYIPGGVNSPVRALKSVGAAPIFIQKAKGTQLTDIDGNYYIDFCLSWGVFIHGHAHPVVNKAAVNAIRYGSSYGIPTLQETTLAKLVVDAVPSVEKVRFVNSGTEAVMSAIRLARAYTGKNIIVKFDGCYHGHADHLLVAAGSGVSGLNSSSSKGVPSDFTKYTISIPFNDMQAVYDVFSKHGDAIAAIILEPVPANMGVVLPAKAFLQKLREITLQNNSLLIFDEVITGFRLSTGGAQEQYGIKPDLTMLGKIVGGGFPAAAFGGKATIMDLLAPLGAVYQAGTLSGNPVAMSAGIETLKLLQEENFYTDLQTKSNQFISALKEIIKGKDIQLNHFGSIFTLFFTSNVVNNFEDAKQADAERFGRFYRKMLEQHVYFSPSPFEANFISAAHSEKQLHQTLKVIKKAI